MTWDFVIIGSGFGGSVSALRLAEKGYKVLVLEKGRRLSAADFPKSNWQLRRWFWLPALGFRGLFKMTFMRHVTVLSGVGVGGGSLVYANTLPIPASPFFDAESWRHLASWQHELTPHYETARRMLGAAKNPVITPADRVIGEVADALKLAHTPTTVAVYFGEAGKTVADPYFGGAGPSRTGCIGCGGCMLGCRYNAKNTLDKNYLYLAEQLGVQIQADTEVAWVRPDAAGGYEITAQVGASLLPWRRQQQTIKARQVIFAGGVLGTVPLLLKLKHSKEGLPKLSDAVGKFIRTNSEALIGVISRRDIDVSQGIAISSIVHTDAHSSLEPVRYPSGSGFFRLLQMPHVTGQNIVTRLMRLVQTVMRHPIKFVRAMTVRNWAKRTLILLYMRSLEGTLRLRLRRSWLLPWKKVVGTALDVGPAPSASIVEASQLAHLVEQKIDGYAVSIINETLLNIPSTAHILGGACMGQDATCSVIDAKHRVHGYPGLYVIDGSSVSANPGVNPSLTICALAERAMSFLPTREDSSS